MKRLLDGRDHFRRVGRDLGFETGDNVPVAIHQELSEVPLDLTTELRIRGLIGKKLIQRRFVVILHLNLGVHRELHVVRS